MLNIANINQIIKKAGGKLIDLQIAGVDKTIKNKIVVSFKRLDLFFKGKHYVKKFYRDEFKLKVLKKLDSLVVSESKLTVKFFLSCTDQEPKYDGLAFLSPERIDRPLIKYVRNEKTGELEEIIVEPAKKKGRPKKTPLNEHNLAMKKQKIEKEKLLKKARVKAKKESKKHKATMLKLHTKLMKKLKE